MPGSISRWDPSSYPGRASAPGVEILDYQQNSKDCKGCGRFDTTKQAGLETQLRCIQNGCSTKQLGGSNKKRKTKMQKKKKNRRTLRKMSKKKIGGVPSSYPKNLTDIYRILGDAPNCDNFEVFDQKNKKITNRSRFDLTEAGDRVTFRANIINNDYGLAAVC